MICCAPASRLDISQRHSNFPLHKSLLGTVSMFSIPVRVGDARCPCQDCDLLSNPHSKCRLTNTIHPIWRYDNFWSGRVQLLALAEPVGAFTVVGSDGRVPPKIYQRMEPALQLATLLLQRARPFLMRLMFAELLPTGVLDEAYKADSAQEAQYDMTMLELADNVLTCTTEPSHEAEAVTVRCPAADGVLYMMLHPRHYEALASDSWPSSDFKDRHQHLWYIAVFLVHEIAHLVWSHRVLDVWIEDPTNLALQAEPCLDSSHSHPSAKSDELGRAQEHFLYQGRFMFYAERSGRQAQLPVHAMVALGKTDLLWQQELIRFDKSLPQYGVVQPESIGRAFCADAWADQATARMEILLSPFRNFVVTDLGNGRTEVRIDEVEHPHHDLTKKSEYTCTCVEEK